MEIAPGGDARAGPFVAKHDVAVERDGVLVMVVEDDYDRPVAERAVTSPPRRVDRRQILSLNGTIMEPKGENGA